MKARFKKILLILAASAAPLIIGNAPAVPRKPEMAAPAVKTQPRNIIFILVDDLRFDGMGFLQPGLHTPNIDRLAKQGTYFSNAVVTSSLCSPSRASILTGQTVRNHGVVDNTNSSEKGLTFFPSYLQHAGYQTAFFGKWHMGDQAASPRPGFDKWVSFLGQGSYWPTSDLSPKEIAAGMVSKLNVDGREIPQHGYITDELNGFALNWLKTERDPKKPFFLYLSHKAVHALPMAPPRYAHQYDKTIFKIPDSVKNTPENYAGKPRWVFDQRASWSGVDFQYNSSMDMTEYLRRYYSSLSAVDDGIGEIYDYLKQNHLDKNTMIIFTSDNGFLIGDHGLIDKRNAYEGSIHVPLVVWAPGLVAAGQTNSGRIRNIDFAPTFLDIAHIPSPPQFDGVTALPLMSGSVSSRNWKAGDLIYEYYWDWMFPMTPTTFAIQRGDLKYIQYYGVYDQEEIYNLKDDPNEMHNLIDDPAYLIAKAELRKALFAQLSNNKGQHAIPFTERTSRGAVGRNNAAAAPFPQNWIVAPDRADIDDDFTPDGLKKPQVKQIGTTSAPER